MCRCCCQAMAMRPIGEVEAGAVGEKAAIPGRLQAAGGAVEQAHAKMLFQFRDPRRSRHRGQFMDPHQHFQAVDIGVASRMISHDF